MVKRVWEIMSLNMSVFARNMQSYMEPTRMKHANTDYMMDRGHKSSSWVDTCNSKQFEFF